MGIATIAKAITAGLTTFAATITQATGDGHVTSVEWVLALVSGLVAGFVTWEVPNAPATTAVTLLTAPSTSTVRGTVPVDQA